MRRFKIFWILLVFILFILPKQGFSETSLEKEWWYEKLKGLSIEEKLKNGFPDFDYIRALVEFEEKYIVKDENIKRQIFEKTKDKVLSKIKELFVKYPETQKEFANFSYFLERGDYDIRYFSFMKLNDNYYFAIKDIDYCTRILTYDVKNDKFLILLVNDQKILYYGDREESLKFILKMLYFLTCPEISCPLNLKRYCSNDIWKIVRNKKDGFSQCYFFLPDSLPKNIDTLWIKRLYVVGQGFKILKIGNEVFIYLGVCKMHDCTNKFYEILYNPFTDTCYGKVILKSKKKESYCTNNIDENIKYLFEILDFEFLFLGDF